MRGLQLNLYEVNFFEELKTESSRAVLARVSLGAVHMYCFEGLLSSFCGAGLDVLKASELQHKGLLNVEYKGDEGLRVAA